MDVKVITRHAISNYGSLLQSVATQRIISRFGHQCQIIDYIYPLEHGKKALSTELKSKPSWNKNLLTRTLYIILRYPFAKYAELQFSKMRNKMLDMTERVSSLDELAKLKADAFVTGSDQVWGPASGKKYDPAYFLSFVDDAAKKYALSASFGRVKFDDETKLDYANLLSRYDSILVREDSAVDIIKSMNLSVQQVLDPTLLISKEEWSEMINEERNDDYVLVYELHSNPKLDDYAKRFAEHVGLPLIRISPSFHQFSRGGKFLWMKDVSTFLALIKNAKYMITDSFHGTAFAINFNTTFIEILHDLTGTRNQSILKLTGLEKRILRDYDNYSLALEEIDWLTVNSIIERERQKSIRIIDRMLKNEDCSSK